MSENKTAMVMREGDTVALSAPGDFGTEHMRIVREAFCAGASPAEFDVLWAGAKSRGLDPVKKQIHFVKRWDSAKEREVWSSQVSIDGFRSIAEATGKYDGQDEPEYEYDETGALALARVRVWRKDITRPFVGVARWNEYVQTTKGGAPSYMWKKMEHTMLSKCAEALALRKAFPESLAGLYTGEEMAQATPADDPPPRQPVRVVQAEPMPPAATPSPPKPSASDLMHRLDGDGRDAAREVIRAASGMPKVRAHAWRKLIGMAGDAEDVARLVVEMRADNLPEEILVKLLTEAEAAVKALIEADDGGAGDTAGAAT